MKESEVELHLKWAVERAGGATYKVVSPGRRGMADRAVFLPNGNMYMVELKTKGGRLSALQKLFAADMARLGQRYACLWTKEQIDEWILKVL